LKFSGDVPSLLLLLEKEEKTNLESLRTSCEKEEEAVPHALAA
jgi:hypothetical protein